jgi:hypothetical protein
MKSVIISAKVYVNFWYWPFEDKLFFRLFEGTVSPAYAIMLSVVGKLS